MASQSIWVLGYGSLAWRPNFEYRRRVHGYIKGWRRVWWQGSTDHRGTPERPGRTVTLHQDPDALTWGVAYELAGSPEQQRETLQYLEWREKQYDIRLNLDLHGGPQQYELLLAETKRCERLACGGDGGNDSESVSTATAFAAVSSLATSRSTASISTTSVSTAAAATTAATSSGGFGAGGLATSSSSASIATSSGNYGHNGRDASTVTAPPSALHPTASAGASTAAAAAVDACGPGEQRVLVPGCLVYVAGPDKARNPNYLGPASLDAIAQQIATSHGPSGANCDYLFGLANVMRQMGVEDEELYELERKVRHIMALTPVAAA